MPSPDEAGWVGNLVEQALASRRAFLTSKALFASSGERSGLTYTFFAMYWLVDFLNRLHSRRTQAASCSDERVTRRRRGADPECPTLLVIVTVGFRFNSLTQRLVKELISFAEL
jgi:hypothetical protein